MREAREVFFIDGVRTPFGKAGPKGQYWRTRADDMGVKAVRELLRRNPEIPPERIGDVVLAATAQVGDQGLTLGRDVALLAGIPLFGMCRRLVRRAHEMGVAPATAAPVRHGQAIARLQQLADPLALRGAAHDGARRDRQLDIGRVAAMGTPLGAGATGFGAKVA